MKGTGAKPCPQVALLGCVVAMAAVLLVRTLARSAGLAPFGTVFGPGNLAAVIVALSIIGAAAFRVGGLSLSFVGFSVSSWWRVVGVLVATIAVVAAVANTSGPFLAQRLGHADTSFAASRFHELRGNVLLTAASIVLVAWLSAAFCEEVIARGFLLPMFERAFLGAMPPRVAVSFALVAQALCFAAFHWSYGPYGTVMALIVGIIFGISFLAGGRSLVPVVLVHAIPDTLTLLAAYQTG